LKKVEGPDYMKCASWFEGENLGDRISFCFPAGGLSGQKYITADMLAYGTHLIKFMIILQEGEDGPAFGFCSGALNPKVKE